MGKLKEVAWRVFEALFFAAIILTVLGNFINWIRGVDDGRPHEGQLCGAAHHWVYVRSSVEDPDLSCEPD
jgi:hypothetical protein